MVRCCQVRASLGDTLRAVLGAHSCTVIDTVRRGIFGFGASLRCALSLLEMRKVRKMGDGAAEQPDSCKVQVLGYKNGFT